MPAHSVLNKRSSPLLTVSPWNSDSHIKSFGRFNLLRSSFETPFFHTHNQEQRREENANRDFPA